LKGNNRDIDLGADYLSTALKMGFTNEQIQNNNRVARYEVFHDLVTPRQRLSTPAHIRCARSQYFLQGIESRQRLGQGIHDRGEKFVFAEGDISDRDRQDIGKFLPLKFQFLTIKEMHLQDNEVWDLSIQNPDWAKASKLYSVVNIGKLVLGERAKIVVKGNILSFTCHTVERANGGKGLAPISSSQYDIGVFAANSKPSSNMHGIHGIDGRDGRRGKSVAGKNTLIGQVIPNIQLDELHGECGGNAEPGEDGIHGKNGNMVHYAEINIHSMSGFEANPLKIISQAGQGEDGGNGGNGGNGGAGGSGGNLCVSDGQLLIQNNHKYEHYVKPLTSGNGGTGGSGGHGGAGGKGGNSGISSNIFVHVPINKTDCLQTLALNSLAGSAGIGGKHGADGSTGKQGVDFRETDHQTENLAKSLPVPSTPSVVVVKKAKDGRQGKCRTVGNIFVNIDYIAGMVFDS
jgi:hypothetical protein